MSLQLFLGSAGSGKSYQLYREVIEQSKKDMGTNYLIIVPEQFTLQTQKDIVTMHPDHGVMNVDILSFLRFAFRVFDEVGSNDYPILEDTGKSMVLRKVVAEKRKDLILFGSNVKKPGFIGELKSLLSELFQYNIGPDDFNKMEEIAQKKPVLKAKLADILTVYNGFMSFMKERYITAEETLVILNKTIDQSQWLKDSVVCLDGFTGFTPTQYQLLGKVMKHAKKVMIAITIDPRENLDSPPKEHQLFGMSKIAIQKLYQIAKDNDVIIEEPIYAETRNKTMVPYRFINSPAMAALENNLFRYPYEVYDKEQDEIRVHSTKDAKTEVAFVSREIKRLIREEGYRYKDIAVITGDIENYGRIVKESFTQLNIPCFIDYKKDILNNPFVELLRSAIAIVSEDYSYESVFRYLRTGLCGISTEDIDLLENYIIATGIRGSKRYSEAFTRNYRGREKVDLDRINATREALVADIGPLYEILKDKSKNMTEYTQALYELGIRLEIEEKLYTYHDKFMEGNNPLAAKEFEQVYGIVMDLYDQMVLLLGAENCTIKEFGEILETGLIEAKMGLIPPGVDEIVVGDTERTRLKEIKVLFFMGMNEGIIPKSLATGGILSDIERELLLSNDIELAPTKRQQGFIEQFYIYLSMTKPKDRLYLTYHKVNSEGKSVNPSYLLGKLKQLIEKSPIINEDENNTDIENVLRDNGLFYLIEGLRSFGEEEVTDLWKELFNVYQSREETNEILKKLISGAFYINEEKGIGKEAARILYGQELEGSVTRLEKYAGCAFAHFMSYGMSLEERREYKLAVPDIGNIFHNAIDNFSKELGTSQYSWHNIPDDVREDMAIKSVEQAVIDYENSYIRSTKRNEYLITRIKRITIRTLWALCNQIKQGSFEPAGYEMAFRHVPDAGISLHGRIDRLDVYEDEDKVYVRVIDYKSGNTTFDLNSIYNGLQQQLSVYLSAAMDYLTKRNPDKEIVPSGIFYYHIDDPIVDKSNHVEDDIIKKLKMNGLINQDKKVLALMDGNLEGPDGSLRPSVKSVIVPAETNKDGELTKRSSVAKGDEIKALIDYVNKKLTEDGKQILEGDTRLNPYRSDKRTACDYCEFRTICGFDSRLPGHGYRNLNKKSTEELKKEIFGED
ncbi:MAG TPA: helicase-exonuclease AddAB subunit AddB [Clostridiales bacterium]|nr:helicase-exonuclease AddAB subunit AddB [Clostridiales bacterium]